MREKKETLDVHQAEVRPDKTLLTAEIRDLVFRLQEADGFVHEVKDIIYVPEEIYRSDFFDEVIYFVPAYNVLDEQNGNPNPDKILLPIFMIAFTSGQKKELINCARRKKWHLSKKHFEKPSIAISQVEREEYGYENYEDDDSE